MPDFAAFITKAQARIACAELCGWKRCEPKKDLGFKHPNLKRGPEMYNTSKTPHRVGRIVPDYPNSLDAMHEAWLSLSDDQKKLFYRHLSNAEGMTRLVHKNVITQDWLVVGATALQCLEAFLKTHGRNVEIEK